VVSDKKWNFSWFVVEHFSCPQCKRSFNVYFKNGVETHKILLYSRNKHIIDITINQIKHYLRRHRTATVAELSDKLRIPVEDIEKALSTMETANEIEKGSYATQ
jgi:hypothetical protein